MENNATAPARQLNTTRGLLKLILLSIITFGIYSIVFMTTIANDVNLVCSKYDGKKTMHYCLLCFLVNPITAGIASFVWFHRISNRIGNELARRGIAYSFSAADFWLWGILGSMIFVGPFIYFHKISKAMNLMNGSYNIAG